MSNIGKNIKKIRSVKKLSQSAFAEKFNLSRTSVGAYEEGRAEPKIETLISIANSFGISIDYLLTKDLTVNEIHNFKHHTNDLLNKNDRQKIIDTISIVERENNESFLKSYKDENFFDQLPKMSFPNLHPNFHIVFEASVPSLISIKHKIHDGDFLISKRTPLSTIKNEFICIIHTKNKLISGKLKVEKNLYLLSREDKQQIMFEKNEIIEIYEIIGIYSTTKNNHLVNSTEQRLHKLENTVQQLEQIIKKTL